MIYSAADIVRILSSDPIISLTAKVEIVDDRYPLLSFGEGIYIYVTQYPSTSEQVASWDLWIVTYDDEPLDIILSQVDQLLPNVKVISADAIIHLTVNELLSERTVVKPVELRLAETSDSIQRNVDNSLEKLREQFEQLAEDINDRMLLIRSGVDGRDGVDGKDGRDGRDGRDGEDMLATEASLGDLEDVDIEDPKRGQVLTYDGDSWVPRFIPLVYSSSSGGGGGVDITQVTGEPMGHTDRTDSVIAFDTVNRVFSIEPVDDSFEIWCKGKRFTITEKQELTLPNTTGFYYIYFNLEAQLAYRTSYFDWPNDCVTAYVYWNADLNKLIYLADERHGIVLDWQTHEYLHRTRGSAYANGFNISNYTTTGDGSLNAHAEFDLGSGTFFDEDLQVDIVHSNTPTPFAWQQDLQGPARVPVILHVASGWDVNPPYDYPLAPGPQYPVYNQYNGSSWTTVEASVNKYIYTFIVATNNLNYPVLAILGQNEYTNITHAEEVTFGQIDLAGFPSLEFRPLYKLIYQVGNYANEYNVRLRSVQDFRTAGNLTGVTASGTTIHSELSGLDQDDHLQYVHISQARTVSVKHTMTAGLTISGSTSALTGVSNPQIDGFLLDGGTY